MSIDNRFFCDAATAGFVTTRVDCAFKPSETKRMYLVKKGVIIETASTNLNNVDYWEDLIAKGDVIPLPDGVFVDVTPNPQEGTIGTKTIKLSDGETAFSFKGSFVSCLVREFAKLESNNSAYDMVILTALNEMIAKYDPDQDIIYPIPVNSIDVRSKPLVADGTDVEQIQDTIIVRYNEIEAKRVKYFDVTDPIANLTGLRAVLIGNIENDLSSVTLKVVTQCEGIEVNDLTEIGDFLIVDTVTSAEIAISTVTPQGGGVYLLDATLTPATVYDVGINGVASNNESYTDEPTEYTAT